MAEGTPIILHWSPPSPPELWPGSKGRGVDCSSRYAIIGLFQPTCDCPDPKQTLAVLSMLLAVA
jgi:hypothetical protein